MMYDIFHGHWLLKFEAYTKSDRTDKRERAIVDTVAPHRHSEAVDIGIPTAVSGNGKEVSDCEIYLEILDPFGSDRNVVRETQTVEPEVIALFQVVGRDIITPFFNQLVGIDDVESAGGRESGIDGKTVQAERGSSPPAYSGRVLPRMSRSADATSPLLSDLRPYAWDTDLPSSFAAVYLPFVRPGVRRSSSWSEATLLVLNEALA